MPPFAITTLIGDVALAARVTEELAAAGHTVTTWAPGPRWSPRFASS